MKKTAIIIGAILICLVLLWVWFYFWRSSYVFTDNLEESKKESLFDKQAKCSELYSNYKDKLSYANSHSSSLSDLSVSYSSSLDNCIAAWIVTMDLWDSSIYDFNIVNASRWDLSIYKCYWDPSDFEDKCNIKTWRSKLYDLTYSDVLEQY